MEQLQGEIRDYHRHLRPRARLGSQRRRLVLRHLQILDQRLRIGLPAKQRARGHLDRGA